MFTECHCKCLRGLSKDQLKEKRTRQDCSPAGKRIMAQDGYGFSMFLVLSVNRETHAKNK